MRNIGLGHHLPASALVLPLALAGCAALVPQPVIENRYAAATFAPQPNADTDIIMSVNTTVPSGGGESIKLTELGERAQAAMVTTNQGKPPTKITATTVQADTQISMETTLKRRVEIALRPATFMQPGDRVDAVRINFRVATADAQNWKITGWTEARNADKVIEIGKLTDTSSNTLTASTGLNIAKFLVDASVSAEAKRELAREMQIRDVGELNAAVDASGTAWIDETAGWRVNLARSRNSIDVTITAQTGAGNGGLSADTVAVPGKLWSDDPGPPKALPPAQVGLRLQQRFVSAAATEPVCAIADLTYRLRRISNDAGRSTFTEADDKVQFVTVTRPSVGFKLSPPPYQPLYALKAGNEYLSFKGADGKAIVVIFGSLEHASAFRLWLLQALPNGGAIASGEIGMQHGLGGLRPINATDRQMLAAGIANQAKRDEAQRNDLKTCA